MHCARAISSIKSLYPTTSATNIGQLSANQSALKVGNFSLGFNLNRSYGIKKLVEVH
ncbi:MAG TPA: hypothetical protein PLK14_12890 [Sediminibacterium sp.]|nr:hypothetical protein [Sediminibacterium sp.]HQS56003.1 hypothetical protein [Sediminibacterium sp.]